MIGNIKMWEEFERNYIASDELTLDQKFKILNGLYTHALLLGVFPPKDLLEGIEIDIKLAKLLNTYVPNPFK